MQRSLSEILRAMFFGTHENEQGHPLRLPHHVASGLTHTVTRQAAK